MSPASRPRARLGRAVRAAALLAVGALVLAGCASIPRGGGVNAVHIEDGGEENEFVILPAGPQPGASPEEILTGFIDAAASPVNNYATAREFLVPSLGSTWKPDTRAVVYATDGRSIAASAEGEARGTISVVPTASVDERGEYSPVPGGKPILLEYTFERVDGQWRIASAPDGIALDQFQFGEVFKPYSLRFFDPSGQYLVPEVRWFPARSSTATRIVKALLDGPSAWLERAVVSAFPQQTRLSSDSVPIAGNVAEVNLSTENDAIDAATLSRMRAQIIATLADYGGVDQVRLSVDGTPQDPAPLLIRTPRTDARALVIEAGQFGYRGGAGVQRVPELSDRVEALHPDAGVLGLDGTVAAVRAPEGVSLVSAAGALLVDARAALIAPGIDPRGFAWTVPRDHPGDIQVAGADGRATPVSVPWPEAEEILSLQIAPDGARALAYISEGGRGRLLVSAIERDDRGVPVALGPPVTVASANGTPLDATWVGETAVASLAANEAGKGQILRATIGGPSVPVEPVDGAVQLVGGSTLQQLRVRTSEGEVLILRSGLWQESASHVTALVPQLATP